MSVTYQIQTGTSGDIIEFEIFNIDGTTPYDVSAATSYHVVLKGPGIGAAIVSATIGGSSNIVQFTTTTSTFTVGGNWMMQVNITWSDTTVSKTSQVQFPVQTALS